VSPDARTSGNGIRIRARAATGREVR
jgi:hypothetical protein